jgi:RNA polymerase sigma-70 factor (ECF subfamily)
MPVKNNIDPVILIINRCKSGNSQAFNELYDLYSKAMFSISMRILNNRNEAEDVLQEGFLQAFRNIKDFDERVSFGSWLKRIIINRSIDVIRKQKHIFQPIDHDDHYENEEPTEDNTDYDVNVVKDSIQALPDGYRIVLSLYLLENFSHKEIALQLNISEGTSKSQYNRAKKKLINLIKEKQS